MGGDVDVQEIREVGRGEVVDGHECRGENCSSPDGR